MNLLCKHSRNTLLCIVLEFQLRCNTRNRLVGLRSLNWRGTSRL
jgi:hypothetical protein